MLLQKQQQQLLLKLLIVVFDALVKSILTRLDALERQQPLLEKEELMFMKDEVLGDDMGTIRNRLESLKLNYRQWSSIAWNKIVRDAETPQTKDHHPL